MNLKFSVFFLLFGLLMAAKKAWAGDSLKVHIPLLQVSKKGTIKQPLYFTNKSSTSDSLFINCYWSNGVDSSLVYRFSGRKRFRLGIGVMQLDLTKNSDSSWLNDDMRHILTQCKELPMGEYHIQVVIISKESVLRESTSYTIDSAYRSFSGATRAFNSELLNRNTRKEAGRQSGSKSISPAMIKKTMRRISRKLHAKGLTTAERTSANNVYLDVFYKGRFVRCYDVTPNHSLAALEQMKINKDQVSGVSTEPENFQSIFSQLKKKEENQKELKGEVALSTSAGTGQEVGSEQDNNFYELIGNVTLPFQYLPITIDGFYTSQDKNRTVKASFIKLHYDTEEAKQQLTKLISSYRQKHEYAQAKGGQLKETYASYISQLHSRRQLLKSEMRLEGIDQFDGNVDTMVLREKISRFIDEKFEKEKDSANNGRYEKKKNAALIKKDSVARVYNRSIEKYKQLEDIERKVRRYEQLVAQYQKANYFDSAMAYSKVKDIDDMSYKEMTKRSEHLLPDGKAKKFINGITNIDAGIFSKEVSSYTLSGQNLKGIDLGYDFGLFQTAMTIGNVEYVNREGILDKYTAYSGRIGFNPVKGQKASVIYYAYSPSGRMISNEEFFKNVDVAMPGFKSPVHIVSVAYEGTLKHGVQFATEAASSFRKSDSPGINGKFASDRMAYKFNVDADIPKTTLTVTGGYEHCGTKFENNSLPIAAAGTDLIKSGVKGVFFENFVVASIDYNYMVQQSTAYKGGNTKWGFEVKTQSKRYPSVSLSYKPFSTFRSATDTTGFSQRLLSGEVWTGKMSYQIKRKEFTIRWTAVYSRNSSQIDTIGQNITSAQINCSYLRGPLNLAMAVGQNSISENNESSYGRVKTISVSGSYRLTPRLTVTGGQELVVGTSGLNRYSTIAGSNYAFKKFPVTIGGNCRFSHYILPLETQWQNIVNVNFGIAWQFSFPWKTKSL